MESADEESGDGEIDFEEFRDLWKLFNIELAKKDQISVLRNQSALHWFDCEQIKTILECFDTSEQRVEVYVSQISSPFLMALAARTRHTHLLSIEFWVLGEQEEFIMAVRGYRPRMLPPRGARISNAFTSRTSLARKMSSSVMSGMCSAILT